MKSIILFAHGSRDPLWHEPIKAIAKKIEIDHPNTLVRCAYLELTEPSLMACVDELVQMGCSELTLFPLFLGVGRHAREDLPLLCAEVEHQYPNLTLKRLPSAGEFPQVIALLAQIAMQD
jgi:sirohydrochlorin cobaltochelatase